MSKLRYRITIRCNAFEQRELLDAGRKSGICTSALVRQRLFGVKPERSARRPSVEASALIALLDRLGRINSQLSFVASYLLAAPHTAALAVERDLRKSLRELRELRPAILAALGKRRTGA